MRKSTIPIVLFSVAATIASLVTTSGTSSADGADVRLSVEACRTAVLSRCSTVDHHNWVENATAQFGSNLRWRVGVHNHSSHIITSASISKLGDASCDLGELSADAVVPAGEVRYFSCQVPSIETSQVLSLALSAQMSDGSIARDYDTARAYVPPAAEQIDVTVLGCSGSISACDRGHTPSAAWDSTVVVEPGADVHWRVAMTNTGNRELTDIVLASSELACATAIDQLSPATSTEVFCSAPTPTALSEFSASATATAQSGAAVDATASAIAVVGIGELAVEVTACTAAACGDADFDHRLLGDPTQVVSWRISLANAGHQAVSNLTASFPVGEPCVWSIPEVLAPGETVESTCEAPLAGDTALLAVVVGRSGGADLLDSSQAFVTERN